MRLPFAKTLGLLVLAVLGVSSAARADIVTVPPGLAPGDTYRLVFVTADTITAASGNIADYNAFVQMRQTLSPRCWH
jgi:hypothetical protein